MRRIGSFMEGPEVRRWVWDMIFDILGSALASMGRFWRVLREFSVIRVISLGGLGILVRRYFDEIAED